MLLETPLPRNPEVTSGARAWSRSLARQPFRRVSGLNEPETPLYPAAQTIAAPGLADTEVNWLALPHWGWTRSSRWCRSSAG